MRAQFVDNPRRWKRLCGSTVKVGADACMSLSAIVHDCELADASTGRSRVWVRVSDSENI